MKDEVKQAQRAKRVAEGHQLEIGAQRAPRFLVAYKAAATLNSEILKKKNIPGSVKVGKKSPGRVV